MRVRNLGRVHRHGKCWGSWNWRFTSKWLLHSHVICVSRDSPPSLGFFCDGPGLQDKCSRVAGRSRKASSDPALKSHASHCIQLASKLLKAAQFQGKMNCITPSVQNSKLGAIKELTVKFLWGINQFCNYWLPNNYFVFEEKKWSVACDFFTLYLIFAFMS